MKGQLFKPFRFGQWIRLAVTGLLAGEMGSAGGCNLQFPFNLPSRRGQSFQVGRLGAPEFLLIALLLLVMLILMVAFIYVSSRMRFVLFDSVAEGQCRITDFWRRRGQQASRYFLFQILFLLCILAGFVLIIGLPLGFFAALGWLRSPREHLFGLIIAGGLAISAFLAMIVLAAVIQVLTKDFVVPQMALENLTVSQSWERLWAMMNEQKGSYLGYLGMKIVLTVGSIVIFTVAILISLLLVFLPVGGVGAVIYFLAKGAGITWNVVTISLLVLGCLIVLVFLVLLFAMISVPIIVFFPAYSMHFFAGRYPPLQLLLFPPL